ncbi:hypothetical protein F5X96DRAFT_622632 [Biscogniauxia mediterranea]|nr:hypothetical protein F5X96DRAFT_622632 [Biscogniauxia mediterranea]
MECLVGFGLDFRGYDMAGLDFLLSPSPPFLFFLFLRFFSFSLAPSFFSASPSLPPPTFFCMTTTVLYFCFRISPRGEG